MHGASLHGRMHCQAGRPLQVGRNYLMTDGEYRGQVAMLEEIKRVRDPDGTDEPCCEAVLVLSNRRGIWEEREYMYPDREAGGRFVFPLRSV